MSRRSYYLGQHALVPWGLLLVKYTICWMNQKNQTAKRGHAKFFLDNFTRQRRAQVARLNTLRTTYRNSGVEGVTTASSLISNVCVFIRDHRLATIRTIVTIGGRVPKAPSFLWQADKATNNYVLATTET
jgi:hypothetical protein